MLSVKQVDRRKRVLCGLTFELSWRQRQDARPELAKMYRVPPAWAWWPAVGAQLERGVRPRWRENRGVIEFARPWLAARETSLLGSWKH